MNTNIVSIAVDAAGGPSALARKISEAEGRRVLHSTVIKWRNTGRIPAQYVRCVEDASGISRYQLRPDVFGEHPERTAA